MNSLKVKQTLIASLIASLSMSAGAEDRILQAEYESGLSIGKDIVYVGTIADTTSVTNPKNTNHFTLKFTGGTLKDLGTLAVDGGILFNGGGGHYRMLALSN